MVQDSVEWYRMAWDSAGLFKWFRLGQLARMVKNLLRHNLSDNASEQHRMGQNDENTEYRNMYLAQGLGTDLAIST